MAIESAQVHRKNLMSNVSLTVGSTLPLFLFNAVFRFRALSLKMGALNFDPRSYQLEMLEHSKKQNTIIAVGWQAPSMVTLLSVLDGHGIREDKYVQHESIPNYYSLF